MMRWAAIFGLTFASGGCFFFPEDPEPMNGGPSSSGQQVDDPSIPDLAYCENVTQWSNNAIEFEEDVLVLVNEARANGAVCGGQQFGAAPAVTMNGGLRCAARVHSRDMDVRGFFSHDNPSGEDPFDRMSAAGFVYSLAGENIAYGQLTPQEVMVGWLDSPGHCANIMDPGFTHLGVGMYFGESGNFWTQAFATPL